MKTLSFKKILVLNTFFFLFFVIFFLIFPRFDIFFSNIFFDDVFISEKLIFIKTIRTFLKNLMIFIPVLSLIILVIYSIKIKKRKNSKLDIRKKFILLGFILGPIIGCGIIANWYFKDQWGRARPVQVTEFNGDKKFTPPFVKTNQCEKNCSWISGEGSAAFSFFFGTIILKNPIFFLINIIFGIVVSSCRILMGGHFLSDNLFACFFMLYLALIYRFCVVKFLKNKLKNV